MAKTGISEVTVLEPLWLILENSAGGSGDLEVLEVLDLYFLFLSFDFLI